MPMNESPLSNLPFSALPLAPPLQQGLSETGFTHCTPIQAECLPLLLKGQDVAGQAQTGTGKTAAFLLAAMQHLLDRPQPEQAVRPLRCLMLAPTRELAIQIHKDAEALGRYSGLKLGLAYGGVDYDKQREQIAAGVDILIGTPGRIIDYFKQHVFHLKNIQAMVLDEADRMFDLGFIKDIRFLLRRMPPPEQRLNMLFSATLSLRVTELAYEHMNSPEPIRVEPDKVTADRVRQAIYLTANEEKIPLLVGLLQHMDPHRTIVFVNTKRMAEKLWGYLEGNGFPTAVLSGDVPQAKRQKLLLNFQRGDLALLIATDVAARGLHIPDVSHVINFDLPQDAEDYVHRIGRTARLGTEGDAISFACEVYSFSLPEIERYIGHKIPVSRIESGLLAHLKPPARVERHRPPAHAERGRPPPRRGRSGHRAPS
jgi:ATP-dependent RNA helicase RhlB